MFECEFVFGNIDVNTAVVEWAVVVLADFGKGKKLASPVFGHEVRADRRTNLNTESAAFGVDIVSTIDGEGEVSADGSSYLLFFCDPLFVVEQIGIVDLVFPAHLHERRDICVVKGELGV